MLTPDHLEELQRSAVADCSLQHQQLVASVWARKLPRYISNSVAADLVQPPPPLSIEFRREMARYGRGGNGAVVDSRRFASRVATGYNDDDDERTRRR